MYLEAYFIAIGIMGSLNEAWSDFACKAIGLQAIICALVRRVFDREVQHRCFIRDM